MSHHDAPSSSTHRALTTSLQTLCVLVLPLIAAFCMTTASADASVADSSPALHIEVDRADVASVRLEVFDAATSRPLYDSGLVDGRAVRILENELGAFGAENLTFEIRAWDSAGEMVFSQISMVQGAESLITEIDFQTISPGTKLVAQAIGLEGDVDVAGTLEAPQVRTGSLHDTSGGAFVDACAPGQAIRSISGNGSVTCENTGAGGDHLGNHVAQQDLQMGSHDIRFDATTGLHSNQGARLRTGDLGQTFFALPGGPTAHRFAVEAYGTGTGTETAEFVIDSNGVVGLNKFDPDCIGCMLQVVGNVEVDGTIRGGSSAKQVRIGSAVNPNIELAGPTTPFIDFSNNLADDFDMRLILSGDDALTIDGGRLGVGGTMTNPQFKIDLPNLANSDGRGRANAWTVYSSGRWKTNVHTLDTASEKLRQLRGVAFDWREEHGGTRGMGFVAEEVGRIFPELVEWEDDGIGAKSLDVMGLVPVLVEALKEQAVTIERLESRLTALEADAEPEATPLTLLD